VTRQSWIGAARYGTVGRVLARLGNAVWEGYGWEGKLSLGLGGNAGQSGKVTLGVLRGDRCGSAVKVRKVKVGRDREGGKAVELSQGHEARRRRLG